MNTYPHDLHRLAHYGLRGNAQHARELRQRRQLEQLGNWFIVLFIVLGVIACL